MTIFRFSLALALSCCISLAAHAAEWQLSDESDPVTDAREVAASITANNNDTKLMFVCNTASDGALTLQFHSGVRLDGTYKNITLRFDGDEAYTNGWNVKGDVAFTYVSRLVWRAAAKAISSSRVIVRYEDYDGRTQDAYFDLPGAQKQFQQC